jgi:hypothetical protein
MMRLVRIKLNYTRIHIGESEREMCVPSCKITLSPKPLHCLSDNEHMLLRGLTIWLILIMILNTLLIAQ